MSTDEQQLGPEAQLATLRAWCSNNHAELLAVHEDLGVSGGAELDKRPGLLAALDAVAAHGAGVLLVAKRDRLARDVVVAAMVDRLAERAGARVLAADGTANGDGPESQLMRTIVDAFAQYERALVRSRTRSALAVLKAKGRRVGAIPFGHRLAPDGERLEADPGEQAVIKRIRRWRESGLSIAAITARLSAEAHPARGARWHATTVSRLLRRRP